MGLTVLFGRTDSVFVGDQRGLIWRERVEFPIFVSSGFCGARRFLRSLLVVFLPLFRAGWGGGWLSKGDGWMDGECGVFVFFLLSTTEPT